MGAGNDVYSDRIRGNYLKEVYELETLGFGSRSQSARYEVDRHEVQSTKPLHNVLFLQTMELRLGPISSHSLSGILIICLAWIGLIWLSLRYTMIPDLVYIFGTFAIICWIGWVIFYMLATPYQYTNSAKQNSAPESKPPTVCPSCQSKHSYRARFTTGGGWRVSEYVCENCGRREKRY